MAEDSRNPRLLSALDSSWDFIGWLSFFVCRLCANPRAKFDIDKAAVDRLPLEDDGDVDNAAHAAAGDDAPNALVAFEPDAVPPAAVAAHVDPVQAQREQQARYRRLTLESLERLGHDGIRADLLMLSEPLAPHVDLMHSNFFRAGRRYDTKQQAAAVRKRKAFETFSIRRGL